MAQQGRRLNLSFDFENGSEVLIPDLVLHSTMEGIVRNAVEATPDNSVVSVRGRSNGDYYVFTVEDSGIGIPEEDWGLVFDGFYQVQETDDYTSGRPYGFYAGGKGMDLFRIKMFSRIYGFGLYFQSRRCRHLAEALRQCPGNVDRCPYCTSVQDCIDSGGTVFEVDLPLTGGKGENTRSA
jgi:signal transduction histidine kinase